MVRAVELGEIGSVGCGRKRCRRCAPAFALLRRGRLPPRSKTLWAGWRDRRRRRWRVYHVAAGHRPAVHLRRALSLSLL